MRSRCFYVIVVRMEGVTAHVRKARGTLVRYFASMKDVVFLREQGDKDDGRICDLPETIFSLFLLFWFGV